MKASTETKFSDGIITSCVLQTCFGVRPRSWLIANVTYHLITLWITSLFQTLFIFQLQKKKSEAWEPGPTSPAGSLCSHQPSHVLAQWVQREHCFAKYGPSAYSEFSIRFQHVRLSLKYWICIYFGQLVETELEEIKEPCWPSWLKESLSRCKCA